MKIAIITSGFLPVVDGVTVSGMVRLQKLSEWGHEVLVFCPDYSSIESIYPNWREYTGNILPGVRIVNLPSTPFMGIDFERNVAINGYPILLKELEKFQPDLVHVDEPERLFFGFFRVAGVDYAKRAGIPCISFFRTHFLDYADSYIPLPPLGIKWVQAIAQRVFAAIYNCYDLTLTTSKVTHPKLVKMGIKNTYYSNLAGFDAENFNPNLRQPGFFESQYGLPQVDQQIKLIFVGRLTPDKGWNFTLKAFPRLAEFVDLNKVAILVVGDGPVKSEIAQGLGQLTSNLHLLGRVAPEKIPALMANSDIHITTSEKEARGLTVLEAFASGIPVIAPRAGGVVENLQDGWNGFLYTPQDIEEFVQKLKILIEDEALRQEMGQRGCSCVGQFGWDEVVQNLVNIWASRIGEKPQIPASHPARCL